VSDIIRHLGQRIREIRIQRGFKSQEEFADYCKLHRTFVGHLETGRKDFRLSTIIYVAEMLGVTLEFLFAGIEQDATPKSKVHRMSKTDSRAMLRELGVLERNIERLKERATPNANNAKVKSESKRIARKTRD
jgi:transcriptional regulator with XRE-family HTH domain